MLTASSSGQPRASRRQAFDREWLAPSKTNESNGQRRHQVGMDRSDAPMIVLSQAFVVLRSFKYNSQSLSLALIQRLRAIGLHLEAFKHDRRPTRDSCLRPLSTHWRRSLNELCAPFKLRQGQHVIRELCDTKHCLPDAYSWCQHPKRQRHPS